MSLQDSDPAFADADDMAEANDSAQDDRYRLTHSSEIGTVLRDLSWQKCVANIRADRGTEAVTTVLKIDPAQRTFVFDWCRSEAECQAMLNSKEVSFSALLRGVPVNFRVPTPAAINFEGGPAFSAAFPEKLYHFQRRRHFRARTLVTKGYRCDVTLQTRTAQLDVFDLSLSGVGLRSKQVTNQDLPVGAIIGSARLDFRELGRMELDLQVVGHWLVGNDASAIHHFGCAFVKPDGRIENTLQRMVFALELAHRG